MVTVIALKCTACGEQTNAASLHGNVKVYCHTCIGKLAHAIGTINKTVNGAWFTGDTENTDGPLKKLQCGLQSCTNKSTFDKVRVKRILGIN